MGSVEPEDRSRPVVTVKSVAAPVLLAGTMVDHFRVMRLIGRGGMGEVYLARDTRLGRRAALKIVNAKMLRSPEALEAFSREAQTTARFNHPNIVTLYAVGEHQGHPYVALEYLQGEDLGSRITARAPGPTESLRIALAIARALQEAHHHGVLHLDLKPSNVVIPADGRPRVVDFGLATTVRGVGSEARAPGPAGSPGSSSSSGQLWGTPVYTAPERWRGEPSVPATDIWALGVILYQLCAHRLPFSEASPEATRDAILDEAPPPLRTLVDVPRPLSELVERCLARAAASRPSAAEVVEALERILGRGRTQPRGESPFRGLLPFDQRHAGLFFGRDAEIDAFVERVRQQPVLPIVGPTGAGKSSFVHAGVIPRLREQEAWVVLHMRPGSRPFVTLADRLRRRETQNFARSGEVTSVTTVAGGPRASMRSGQFASGAPSSPVQDTGAHAALLQLAPNTLSLALRTIAEDEEAKVLLVVDQLEELVTMTEDDDERRAFLQAICGAADDPLDPIRVVLTVRDDFLGRLPMNQAVRDAMARVTVISALDDAALREIVGKPVEAVGYRYEDEALTDQIIAAVEGEPGCLPLLQFAGQMLWDRRDEERRLLLRSAYERMGGVEGALAKHADEVLAGLSDAELRIARQILLLLVSPDRTRRFASVREVEQTLGPQASPVLQRLTDSRLLSVTQIRDAVERGPRVELAHESLVHTWARLSRWLDETREELGLLADATAAAELWDKRGRRPAELWEGDALRDAVRTLDRLAFDLPEGVARFVAASEARQRARVRRRWLLLGAVFTVLVAIASTSVYVAVLVADKERVAQRQRAGALREGARAASRHGQVLEARAKLRLALEHDDSADARGQWWALWANPAVWRADVGTFGLSIAFAPDGSTVATGCQDVGLCLLDVPTRAVTVLRGHTQKVAAVDFSPDGRLVAAGDWSGGLLLWSVQTHQIVQRLPGHAQRVMAVAFDPQSQRLASAGRDRVVRVWALDAKGEPLTLEGHTGGIEGVDFSPDGRWLASASEDKTVRVWDPASGQVRWVLPHDAAVEDVVFDPQGQWLASGTNDGSIVLWSAQTGKRLRVLRGHQGGVRSLSLSGSGARLASASYDGTITVWDMEEGSRRRTIAAHPGSVRDVSLSPDGRWMASTGYDRTAGLWRVDAVPRAMVDEGHATAARGVDFSPDGSIVASGGFDHNVRLWDAKTGEPLDVLDHDGAIYGVDFSPDGRWLASASAGGDVRLWDAQTRRAAQVLRGHEAAVYTVHFSPDSTRLASGSRDQTVRLWDLPSGEPLRALEGHRHAIWDVRWGPLGRRVASASWDYSVRVWDAGSGREVRLGAEHDSAAYGVAFTPDGRAFVSTGADGTVRRWELADGTHRVIAADGRGTVLDVAPDGQHVAVAMADGSTRVWTLEGEPVHVLRGHSNQVNTARYSADGERLATVADDGIVRVWDATTGHPYWRAPVMLLSPPRLLSHRGWSGLDGTPADVPGTTWAHEADAHARLADHDLAGGRLCVRTYDQRVQIWDLGADRELVDIARPGLRDVRAVDGGCVAQSDAGAELVRLDGTFAPLVDGPTDAIGIGPGVVLVAAEHTVHEFTPAGEPRATHGVDQGVTALTRTEHALVLGYRDGTLATAAVSPEGPALADFFEHAPSGPVNRLVSGPMRTIIAGYADGTIGMWSLADGSNLARARLHGPIVHLALHEQRLYAASDLGRSVTWDLSVFHRDYCELLCEVWEAVPVVWERGRAVARTRPQEHRCNRPRVCP